MSTVAGPTHAGRAHLDRLAPPLAAHPPLPSASPLSIGFDGRTLASPAGGVRRYVFELFAALAAMPGLRVTAVGLPEGAVVPPGVNGLAAAVSLPTNLGWMLTGLPLTARRVGLDVFHAPAYTAPLPSPRPLVLTIHDVSYARHPEWYPYRRDPLRRAFYRRSARAADRIVTDSAFSKREIAAAYAIDPSLIDVVPLAPSSVFGPGPSGPLPPGVPGRFLLHVGDLHARRNVTVAVEALHELRTRRPDLGKVPLVLAGVRREEVSALSGGDAVIALGAVEESALLALYRGAAALLYPSRYEGFGLPILEAMACGLPVIASQASCIPEVAGAAAVLVDPDDVDGWAAAIERVIEDAAWAARLQTLGLVHAAGFSWQRTARETAAVYRAARERA